MEYEFFSEYRYCKHFFYPKVALSSINSAFVNRCLYDFKVVQFVIYV